jgi:hypothetical protein
MSDANSIIPEPENKSFDKNIQLGVEVLKICFNPCCNNKSENWITIIGRFAGYKDYEVPYCVCDNCNSFLGFRLQALNHLVNTLQDMGKVQRTGVDIEAHNPPSDKMTVTTKDLNNLTFETSAYDMMESEEVIKQYDEPKVCYNSHCNEEGTHWIDIINATTLLADHEISYCVCDRYYAFFEYRRKDPMIFTQPKKPFNALEIPNGKEEEEIEKVAGINLFTGKEAITTKDLRNLLESTSRVQG